MLQFWIFIYELIKSQPIRSFGGFYTHCSAFSKSKSTIFRASNNIILDANLKKKSSKKLAGDENAIVNNSWQIPVEMCWNQNEKKTWFSMCNKWKEKHWTSDQVNDMRIHLGKFNSKWKYVVEHVCGFDMDSRNSHIDQPKRW